MWKSLFRMMLWFLIAIILVWLAGEILEAYGIAHSPQSEWISPGDVRGNF